MYTGHQASLEQPNFCSAFIGKIWSHKASPELRDRVKSPIKNQIKSESTQKSELDKSKGKNELICIANKLKRVTCTLPCVLQSNEAYGAGEKSCEICSITREKYKSDLQAAKVVGILVDSVVEREQIEKIDDDNEEEESNEGSSTPSKDKGRGDKLSFNFSIYCEDDVINHNLKCVLIKLQKTIGDIMVQVCFVKTKKLGNEEKYKIFNISTSDLKLLKYDYTNLTDAIIPLFKNPSANKKTNSEVCVPCVKEKLCEHSTRLRELLKSGRNLQVVMRNDGANQGMDRCCYRAYPHVHADVQGKPIVLKYSMPFKVKPPSKSNRTSNDLFETDCSNNDVLPQKTPSKSDKPQYLQQAQSKQEVPYYEWPEDILYHEKDFKNLDQDNPSYVVENRGNSNNFRSLGAVENNGHEPELQASHTLSEKHLQSKDFSTTQTKSETSTPSQSTTKLRVTPKSSQTSLLSNTSSSISLLTSNKSQKSNNPQSLLPQSTVLPAVLPQKSLTLTRQKPSLQSNLDSSEEFNLSEVESKSQSKKSLLSSLYCGCNYDKAYEKLGYQPKTQQNPTTVKSQDSWNLESSSSESLYSHFSEGLEKNDEPRVPFSNKPNSTTAFPVVTTQPSTLMFSGHSSKNDRKSDVNLNESQYFPQEANEAGKTPFGGETDDIGVYAAKVDSLLLTKERWSHGGGLSKSSVKINVSPEDKAVAAAFKSFIDEPKYVVQSFSTTEDSLVNTHHKTLNHQVNKMKILKYLGRENLLSLCCPAECCKTNIFLEAKGSTTELPFSPSLYSLPLDHNDIEYLSKATGKLVSYEDIMLLAEEETQAKDNDWEIKYVKDTNCQNKAKWLRAFGEMDIHKESSDNMPNSQTKASAVRRGSLKNVIIKEEPRLSTIVEEGQICFSDDERPFIPYLPSIPSLPLNEEEKRELVKKHRPSILKHTTKELRYFTVEFTENIVKDSKKELPHATEFEKMNENCLKRSNTKTIDKAEKTMVSAKTEGENKSYDSFHSCSSSTELTERIEVNPTTLSKDEPIRNYVDNITMLNAIHLCDINYDYFNDSTIHLNPLRTTFYSSSTHENLNYCSDGSEYFCLPERKKKKRNDTGFVPEINDCYVKDLILGNDKTLHSKKNSSYTVIQNPKYKIESCTHIDRIVGDKKQKVIKQNNRAELPVYSPALINTKQNVFKNVDKGIQNDKLISTDHTSHKYISVKLNKSYTMVKDVKQNENSKSNLSEKMANINGPKISYTVMRNKDILRNICKENVTEEKHITINYSKKQMLPSNKYSENCEIKTNNFSQYNINKMSNRTKLELENLNANNYIDDKKKTKQEINKRDNSNELKISCNLMKNLDTETNTCEDGFTKKIHITTNHFKKLMLSSNNCTQKYEMKTNNSSQCNKYECSNWDKLKLDKSNVKNYVAEQQHIKQKMDGQEMKLEQLKDLKKKPMLLHLPHSINRRMECTVTLPRTYFPNIQLICVNDLIPVILLIPNQFQRNSDFLNESLRFKTLSNFGKTHTLSKEKSRKVLKPYLGQTFQEINNVRNLQHNNQDKVLFAKTNFDIQTFDRSEYKNISINAKTKAIHPYKSAVEIQTDKNEFSFCKLDITSKNNIKFPQAKEKGIQNGLLCDKDNNPLYLFDSQGRPLADKLGRVLQNIKGGSLIILGEQNPICDLDNNPICDSLGHVWNRTEFNSVEPLTEDVLKSFSRDSGDPILLYNVEGRPLNSVSGTMLVDCYRKSLIQFGCVNSKISDHVESPIFSSTGEQFNGLA